LFGAKNSKLYALKMETGERLWSYRTSNSLYKANLDSSPSLFRGADGVVGVAVGSYGGKIFLIPADQCRREKPDEACERGGQEDLVAHEGPIEANSAELRFVSRDGRALSRASEPVGLFEPIQLRLIAYENGHQVENAAISEIPLSVDVEPAVAFRSVVSSDGTLMNILPTKGFAPGTRYKIRVKGSYYRNTHWVWNRFKWLGMRAFQGNIEFETAENKSTLPVDRPSRLWGVQSMYLTQPQALDTYIPAALDGQAFLVSGFAFQPQSGRFLLLAQPALPTQNRPIGIPEPSKSFVLEAESLGRHFVARGAMSIAAMGGAMTFKEAQFSGVLAESGRIEKGGFFVNSSCLDIKGNGTSYQFPLTLVSWICNSRLHVVGLGPLEGQELDSPVLPEGLTAVLAQDQRSILVKDPLKKLSREAHHLVNFVEYDPSSVKVHRSKATELLPSCWSNIEECKIDLPTGSSPKGAQRVVFLNQVMLAL